MIAGIVTPQVFDDITSGSSKAASMCDFLELRHDHWFDISLMPVETKSRYVDDDFCYGPWANEQQKG